MELKDYLDWGNKISAQAAAFLRTGSDKDRNALWALIREWDKFEPYHDAVLKNKSLVIAHKMWSP